ncbi:hypothetical protein RKD52_001857 [Metabacillus sp. SLBN-84]
MLTLSNCFAVSEGAIRSLAYPPTSFCGFRGYDSRVCLPSHIVSRFPGVRFLGLLTLPHRFSVSGGTIHAFAYPPESFLGFRGYDSRVCLPSHIVSRFPRVRFARLLTLPNRFSVSGGTIHAFAYLPTSFCGFRGYDSLACLPSHIVLRFPGVRFARLLTLPHRFSVSGGTIHAFAYPLKSFLGFRGYDSGSPDSFSIQKKRRDFSPRSYSSSAVTGNTDFTSSSTLRSCFVER